MGTHSQDNGCILQLFFANIPEHKYCVLACIISLGIVHLMNFINKLPARVKETDSRQGYCHLGCDAI
jgi:hypothetical protein